MTNNVSGYDPQALVRAMGYSRYGAVLFGSSTAGRNGPGNGFETVLSVGVAPDGGYWNWMNHFLGNPFQMIANLGISSNTTAQQLARIGDVLAVNAKYVFLSCGHADIEATAPAITADETIANIKNIYRILLDSGRTIVVVGIHPNNNGSAQAIKCLKINAFSRDFCAQNSNCYFVDAYSKVIDYASATGAAKAGMLQSDNIHMTSKACRAVGRLAADVLAREVHDWRSNVMSIVDVRSNDGALRQLNTNPFMTGAVAGMASGYTTFDGPGGSTITPTNVARADGFGFDQQLAISVTAAGIVQLSSANFAANGAIGMLTQTDAYVSATGMTNVKGISVINVAQVDTVNYYSLALGKNSVAVAQYDQTDLPEIHMMTPIFKLQGTTINFLRCRLEVEFFGAGTATVKMGRAQMLNIPAPQ